MIITEVTNKSLNRFILLMLKIGAIAQLVEHLHGMQGVRSSSLLGSTEFSKALTGFFAGERFYLLVLMHLDLAR